MDEPYPWDVFLGRHAYGMSPEAETGWLRFFFVVGIFIGFALRGCLP